MANCHRNFLTVKDAFHSKIALDDSKRESLITSRNALRKHIRANFKEKDRPSIKFQIQGSFAMGTTVNPINGDYDIDDGLYFSPELAPKSSAEAVHSWVVDVVSGYKTADPAIDKKRCVRIPFKAGYHVDIPVYDLKVASDEINEPYLAVKGEGWIYSDPRAITSWFNSRVSDTNPLLRRLVRYFKAWADYQNKDSKPKMPSGLILTFLAAEEFQYDSREDVAFAGTAATVLNRLRDNEAIRNPKDKNENLRDRITDAQYNNFMERLDSLVQHAETALEHDDAKEAAEKHWVLVFGTRFPIIDDDSAKGKSTSKKHESAGIIGVGTTSA